MNVENIILKHALHNAVSFGGKANPGAVMGKILAENPDLKKNAENLKKIILETVEKINSLSVEEQKKLLKENFSGFLEERKALKEKRKKDAQKEKELPPLPGDTSKVVMRMAPFPSGPLHIGNARMAVLNHEYVKKYNGKLILFFDDTVGTESKNENLPEKNILPEAYQLISEGLKWLGVSWDEEYYKSDRLEIFYEFAEKLLKIGKAYVCTCDATVFREEYKKKKKECPCRKNQINENIEKWKKMLSGNFKPGEAVVRLKTGMNHPNPALRDHVIMRITEKEHPRVGKKYRVWPLLEFSWAVDDYLIGSTHILRGADLVKEDWVEEIVWDMLNLPKKANFLHYGKFRLEETEGTISKSKSKEKILSGKFIGWDDPRTWSLQSLARRGIKPQAVRKFLLSFGMSVVDVVVETEVLYGINRELIDSEANRYFFVKDPEKVQISEETIGKVPLHPDFDRGNKEYNLKKNEEILIEKKDLLLFNEGAVRLKGLGVFELENTRLTKSNKEPVATIHFVPLEGAIKIKILMPNGEWLTGLMEKAGKEIQRGSVIQFERFGFCKLDKWKENEAEFWFTHK